MLQEMAVYLFFSFRYSCKVPDFHLTGKRIKDIVAKLVETARELKKKKTENVHIPEHGSRITVKTPRFLKLLKASS